MSGLALMVAGPYEQKPLRSTVTVHGLVSLLSMFGSGIGWSFSEENLTLPRLAVGVVKVIFHAVVLSAAGGQINRVASETRGRLLEGG